MDKILEWFTKGRVFFLSLISSGGFFILFSIPRKTLLISYDNPCFECFNIAQYSTLILMAGVAVLVPSLFFLFNKKEEVFKFWKKTLFIYLSIYLLNIIFMPWYFGDEFLHLEKDLVAIGISMIYFVFSIVLIIYKSFKKNY